MGSVLNIPIEGNEGKDLDKDYIFQHWNGLTHSYSSYIINGIRKYCAQLVTPSYDIFDELGVTYWKLVLYSQIELSNHLLHCQHCFGKYSRWEYSTKCKYKYEFDECTQ